MKIIEPVLLAVVLAALPLIAASVFGAHAIFGIALPYLAFAAFAVGMILRAVAWVRTPVPFNITTTAGQQKSLDGIRHDWLENPTTPGAAALRVATEVFLFRSLFRNTRSELVNGRLVAQPAQGLWLAGLAFHYAMLVIVVRHFRFFAEVLPAPVRAVTMLDGLFQIGPPTLYLTDVVFVAAVTFLFWRRTRGQMRVLSLRADYFPLALLLLIALTGIAMRYALHVDIPGIKNHMLSLLAFHPSGARLDAMFYSHIFLICVLAAYFPASKLVHAGAVFLSPTRNMPNDSRMRRHVNPWDYPVAPHSYAAYEDDFREKMIEAGLPVDKGASEGEEGKS
jgi:nitrate reductase gamma subunit